MKNMVEPSSSTKWILAMVGVSIAACIYLICCICSIHKAVKDRRQIIERNCAKRNKKYLKEMGLDSDKLNIQSDKMRFAISKKEIGEETGSEAILINQPINNTNPTIYPPTKAKRINLDNIDEMFNESINVNVSSNSSLVAKTTSENYKSESTNSNYEIISDQPIVTSLKKPTIIDSIPKVYYLKAHNPNVKEKGPPSNWITERLNNASSFAQAQRQLQHGLRRAPLAKQNSGFSSMDEDSSASQF